MEQRGARADGIFSCCWKCPGAGAVEKGVVGVAAGRRDAAVRSATDSQPGGDDVGPRPEHDQRPGLSADSRIITCRTNVAVAAWSSRAGAVAGTTLIAVGRGSTLTAPAGGHARSRGRSPCPVSSHPRLSMAAMVACGSIEVWLAKPVPSRWFPFSSALTPRSGWTTATSAPGKGRR